MISIVEHIEYLIGVHDCVVIPQWGAFIAQYSGAKLDDNRITAPRRTISFNAQVDHNDGLIATSVMRREGISYESAMTHVEQAVAELKRRVAAGDRVFVGSLGFFVKRRAGVEFTSSADPAGNCYGLNDFTFDLLNSADKAPAELVAEAPRWWQRKQVRGTVKWAASIALVIGLGFMLSTPIINNDNEQQAGFNITTIKSAEPEPAIEPDEPVEEQSAIADTGNCMLVVATFTSEKQCADFIAMHPQVEMKTIRFGKHYRVIAARGTDVRQMLQAQAKLPRGMVSWIAK